MIDSIVITEMNSVHHIVRTQKNEIDSPKWICVVQINWDEKRLKYAFVFATAAKQQRKQSAAKGR